MKIPSREECMQILTDNDVPERVIAHSLTVNKVALFITENLRKAGERINTNLVNATTLLHDLDKIQTLDNHKEHGKVAEKMLVEIGYPEVGKIVGIHTPDNLKKKVINSWEEKIMIYSDSRALFDKIVSVEERFRDLRERYPHFREESHELEKLEEALEREIFNKLKIKPEDLNSSVII